MRKILVFAIFIITSFTSEATTPKIVAGQLFYIYASPLTYEVSFKFYTNCSDSIGAGTIPMMVYSSLNCGIAQTVQLKYDSSILNNGALVTLSCSECPDSLNICAEGYLEYTYKAVVVLDTNCTEWTFQVNTLRANNIANINTINNGSILATVNNVARPINSSLVSTSSLFWKVGANLNMTFASNYFNLDSDSLVFENHNPQDSSFFALPQNTSYNTGFTLLNPLGNASVYNVNANTGTILFNAQQTGLYTTSVKCLEYDQITKKLVGTTICDRLFYVSPCYTKSVSFKTNATKNISNLQGAFFSTDTLSDIEIATQNMGSFQIQFKTLDKQNTKEILCDNSAANGSTFNYNYVTDAAGDKLYTIHFNWLPQTSDLGIHNVLFTIQDSFDCNFWRCGQK
jgi:hypothetical protein